jgi:hypothetical protein
MNALRRNRLTRSIAVLVFLLGVLTVSLTALPENVNASCGQEFYWTYYDESGNPVGACWGSCGGPSGCWGSWSPDQQGYSAECPCWP